MCFSLPVLLVSAFLRWLAGMATLPALSPPLSAAEAQVSILGLTSSRPDSLRLTARQIDHLVVLARVWGFVKYYHPAVAAGTREWDQELLGLVPLVLQCQTRTERNLLLSGWLHRLGPVPRCAACAPLDSSARVLPTLAWLDDTGQLGSALSAQLRELRQHRAQGGHAYVYAGPAGPAYYRENSDGQVAYPHRGYRLLALCRYWNIVEYFFPYKYAIGEPWPAVLAEFVPRVVAAPDAEAYHLTMLALIARIHDTHATLMRDPILQRYWGGYQAPVRLVFVGEQPVVAQLYPAAGPDYPLERGDVITHVGPVPVARWIRAHEALVPASNRAAQLRNMAGLLLRGATDEVPLHVLRAGQSVVVVAPRRPPGAGWAAPRPASADSCYRLVQPDIGYLDLGTVRKAQLPHIMRSFQATKGLILDQRNYPTEFMVYALTPYLLAKSTAFAQITAPDLQYPGQFGKKAPLVIPVPQQRELPAYAGRVIILVNELTQSSAEFTAMALRAVPGAVVLGSTTAGADGNISNDIFLPGGMVTRITGLGVYYPTGGETQRVGIVPDVVVTPSIEGLKAGRDEVLEQAMALLNRQP